MNEKLNFAVENIELIEDVNNSQFATLKIDAFASGKNRHNLIIGEDAIRKAASSILEKPLVWVYNKITQDAGNHDPLEVAVGFIPHNSPLEFRKLDDQRLMFSVIGKLWTRYSGKMMEIFERDKNKPVSVEIEVLEKKNNSEFGIDEILNYCYQCITILGQTVIPAIPNACADLVSFAAKEKEEYELALQEFSNKYYDVDFTIPPSVRDSAQKSLEEHKKNGGNATSVSLAMARFLIKNEKITPEKVRAMARFFNSKVERNILTLGFFGGKEGSKWSKEIYMKLEEIDNRQLSYFEGNEGVITFPYTSLEDAPENMKKLDGVSLTLEQVNQIAKVADAIGVSKEKNGYAIAKAQFKKNHYIKDGKWVEKEMSMSDEEFSNPEDLGNGEALKVDKSKDKISDSSWESVDKTSLMHKVLNASNYKTLVNDVYLLVEDGWEEHPSSSLKYPVMQILSETLVYNRGALGNALARATQQNETGIVNKLHGIYEKLDLNNSKKEEFMDGKGKELEEEMAAKEEVIEKDKKESTENEKEKPENKGEKMSLDGNLDVAAMLAIFEDETETYTKLVEDNKSGNLNCNSLCSAMFSKITKMAEESEKAKQDKDAYMAENEELKKFKSEIDAKQFAFEVENTLNDVSDTLNNKDKIKEYREDSKNFNLSNIDAWKNKVKAMAYTFSKDKTQSSDGINRIAISWVDPNSAKEDAKLENGWV